MSLGAFTPVVQWVKQFRIQTGQACQVLRVYLIGFALVGVDEPQFAGVGHKHLVAALLQDPARPRRVGTRLDCYAYRRLLGGEASPEGLRGGAQSRPSSITWPLS